MPLVITAPSIAHSDFSLITVQSRSAPAIDKMAGAIFQCARSFSTSKPYPNARVWQRPLQMVHRAPHLAYHVNVDPHQELCTRAIDALYEGYTADAINAQGRQLRRRCPNYKLNRAIRQLGCPVRIALDAREWTFNVPEEPMVAGPGEVVEGLFCVSNLSWTDSDTTIRGILSYIGPLPPAQARGRIETLRPYLPAFAQMREDARLRLSFTNRGHYFRAHRHYTSRTRMLVLTGSCHHDGGDYWADHRMVQVHFAPAPRLPPLV